MTTTAAELLTELKAAILCGTADITAAQEWCRALDVVIAAHRAEVRAEYSRHLQETENAARREVAEAYTLHGDWDK